MNELYYLKLLTTKGIGPKTLFKILNHLNQRGETVKDFFGMSPHAWRTKFGLSEQIIASLQQENAQAAEYFPALQLKGVQMLALGQRGYPAGLRKALGDLSPPVLFYWGNLELLNQPDR